MKKQLGFLPQNVNFLILVPPAAGIGGDKAMSAADLRDTFVGNTVVAELPEGTAYDLVLPDGVHIGVHPTLGKRKRSWQIDSKGEACVTWRYSTGTIENCGTVVDLG
jgi:hypothetical protein